MQTSGRDHPRLILASSSPRRRFLLEQAGLDFSVIPASVDEEGFPDSPPEDYVRSLAQAKAGQVADRHPRSWVIGADTEVIVEGAVLGKPQSEQQAREMIRRLSGKTHQVFTGYALCCREENRAISGSVCTDVTFRSLSEREIGWYVRTGEPFDKAGGYGIQGIGSVLVREIRGSYTNVVGLPVCEVVECLLREKVIGLDADSGKVVTDGKAF